MEKNAARPTLLFTQAAPIESPFDWSRPASRLSPIIEPQLPFLPILNRNLNRPLPYLVVEGECHDFTRLSVVGCSAISFPSMIALQLDVIVSASSKVIVKACMCDSVAALIPQV